MAGNDTTVNCRCALGHGRVRGVHVVGNETEPIPVGVAEYALSTGERALRTSGVGSCGVVAVHDDAAGVSGLLHFMLPDSNGGGGRGPAAKFADSGIEAMLDAFEAEGGRPARAWAKLTGGATMIDFETFERPIGEQNVEAARTVLDRLDVPIRAADVGGDAGRRVTFYPDTGELLVKTAAGERRLR